MFIVSKWVDVAKWPLISLIGTTLLGGRQHGIELKPLGTYSWLPSLGITLLFQLLSLVDVPVCRSALAQI